MTDDGSLFDDDGEWVTNVPDDDQDETADNLIDETGVEYPGVRVFVGWMSVVGFIPRLKFVGFLLSLL